MRAENVDCSGVHVLREFKKKNESFVYVFVFAIYNLCSLLPVYLLCIIRLQELNYIS